MHGDTVHFKDQLSKETDSRCNLHRYRQVQRYVQRIKPGRTTPLYSRTVPRLSSSLLFLKNEAVFTCSSVLMFTGTIELVDLPSPVNHIRSCIHSTAASTPLIFINEQTHRLLYR